MENIRRIWALLEEEYGRPEFSPDLKPLDEFILTILSQNTSAVNYRRAFASLRRRFETWDEVLQADVKEIEDAIRCGGLAKIKAERIKTALDEIHARHCMLDLDFLSEMPDEDALAFLMQFNGVGIKTASCVLMFSMGRPVFPVDTHVHRIAGRLGLIGPKVSPEEAHGVLHGMIPDELVYSMHLNLVTHGRRVCKARNPACDVCPLLELCSFGQRALS